MKPRIEPLPIEDASEDVKHAFEHHVATYVGSRITNMKATLGHSKEAFEVYMGWYPLYEKIQDFLGKRLAYLFAFSISEASDCPLCSTFFRKIIIENGESPEELILNEEDSLLLVFGSQISIDKGQIKDEIYQKIAQRYTTQQIVLLVAFAGQMIATNLFNNVLRVEIDEYLTPYLPLTKL